MIGKNVDAASCRVAAHRSCATRQDAASTLTVQGGMVAICMGGLPDGAMAVAEGFTLIQPHWYPIAFEPATGGVNGFIPITFTVTISFSTV